MNRAYDHVAEHLGDEAGSDDGRAVAEGGLVEEPAPIGRAIDFAAGSAGVAGVTAFGRTVSTSSRHQASPIGTVSLRSRRRLASPTARGPPAEGLPPAARLRPHRAVSR
jgi:hypothetical protein